jgi:hypothetical protein
MSRKGRNTMNKMNLDQEEKDLLICEISDESLETLGRPENQVAHYTLWYCTALNLCPGP